MMTGPLVLLSIVCSLLLQSHLAEAGTTYVRWGRTTCNDGARVVYKGYMAGAHWAVVGGGTNFLCASDEPRLGRLCRKPSPLPQIYPSRLYGAKFRLFPAWGWGDKKPFSFQNAGIDDLQNQDAVCVVCYRKTSSESLVIPGRQDCGKGNTDMRVEYKGYLMGAYEDRYRMNYVCVDEAPEVRQGSAKNEEGPLLAPVEPKCASLPCTPYVDKNEITCAVCSI